MMITAEQRNRLLWRLISEEMVSLETLPVAAARDRARVLLGAENPHQLRHLEDALAALASEFKAGP